MRIVIQRVNEASVVVSDKVVGEIKQGLLVLVGVCDEDTKKDCDKLADKLTKLRIFADENDKTNLSIDDIGGDLLIISQFTLYADCRKGNRPSFIRAGGPAYAEDLYEYFLQACRSRMIGRVETGQFGADMKVHLVNDGPFTIVLEFINGEIAP